MALKRSIPRHISILSKRTRYQISKMRNAIQHLENDILDRRIVEHQPVALQPLVDAIELGADRIEYNDLAIWAKRLDAVAGAVALYHE